MEDVQIHIENEKGEKTFVGYVKNINLSNEEEGQEPPANIGEFLVAMESELSAVGGRKELIKYQLRCIWLAFKMIWRLLCGVA